MKIGFDAKRAYNNFSGLGNYSRNLIRQMLRFYPDDHYYLYTPKIKANWIDVSGKKAGIYSPESPAGKMAPSLWRSFGLAKRLRHDGIEAYHGLSNELPFGIHRTRVRSVVSIHDLIFIRYPELYKAIDRTIYRKKLNYCVKAADHIIAISGRTRDDLVEFAAADPGKISVVYQTCDPAFSGKADELQKSLVKNKYDLPSGYMIYVGTIEKRKNLLSIVRALNEGSIDFPLVVIGRETPYAETVKEYIEKHQMKNIFFLRNVPNEDLPVLYQMATVFIYPSSFEGFGIPVLEALNSGVPVIAGKGSCLEETGGSGSLYTDPSNIEGLSDMIRKVLDDSALRKKMILRGYAHAEKFTDENAVKEIHAIYESLPGL